LVDNPINQSLVDIVLLVVIAAGVITIHPADARDLAGKLNDERRMMATRALEVI
jgi:hypothetical protein